MKKIIGSLSLFLLPVLAFAQNAYVGEDSGPNLLPLRQFVSAIGSVVNALIPVLIGLALAVFFWGLVRYLWGTGGKSDTAGAKNLMIWGLVTLFVMISVWGIIRIAQNALGVSGIGGAAIPTLPSTVPLSPVPR